MGDPQLRADPTRLVSGEIAKKLQTPAIKKITKLGGLR
jgi:hypothetical protein